MNELMNRVDAALHFIVRSIVELHFLVWNTRQPEVCDVFGSTTTLERRPHVFDNKPQRCLLDGSFILGAVQTSQEKQGAS